MVIYTVYLTLSSYHVTYAIPRIWALSSCLSVTKIRPRTRGDIWRLTGCNAIRARNHLLNKETFIHLAKLVEWLSYVVSTYLGITIELRSYHVTHKFLAEFTLYCCLNFKELSANNRHNIWKLSNWNRTRTHYLVCRRNPKHLAKLAKWLSIVVSTNLYYAFDCMFLYCEVHVYEWIHTL